jgi:hypothetical protein
VALFSGLARTCRSEFFRTARNHNKFPFWDSHLFPTGPVFPLFPAAAQNGDSLEITELLSGGLETALDERARGKVMVLGMPVEGGWVCLKSGK